MSLSWATRTLTSSYTLNFFNFTTNSLVGFSNDCGRCHSTVFLDSALGIHQSLYCESDETMLLRAIRLAQ